MIWCGRRGHAEGNDDFPQPLAKVSQAPPGLVMRGEENQSSVKVAYHSDGDSAIIPE